MLVLTADLYYLFLAPPTAEEIPKTYSIIYREEVLDDFARRFSVATAERRPQVFTLVMPFDKTSMAAHAERWRSQKSLLYLAGMRILHNETSTYLWPKLREAAWQEKIQRMRERADAPPSSLFVATKYLSDVDALLVRASDITVSLAELQNNHRRCGHPAQLSWSGLTAVNEKRCNWATI